MKNKILCGIAVLAIAAVAAWNVNLNAQKSDLSDLALANVEALGQEIIVGTPCYYYRTHYCIQFWPEPDWELWIDFEKM